MDNTSENAPLAQGSLAGSQESLGLRARPASGSNSRALKIAGLTTLVCMLVASQVFTAYMVFGQKHDIHTLQRNNEKMSKQLSRRPPMAKSPVRMHVPMPSLALLTDFSDDSTETTKTAVTKLEDAIVSVEKQVKDLIQDPQLPQFNATFLSNLQGLKRDLNETDWRSFETWMRYWLIFQMAQQPAPHTSQPATMIMTKCQTEAAPGPTKLGSFKPQCDEEGRYRPMQCWHATGYCWCVDESGATIEGTLMRGRPDCHKGTPVRSMMALPSLMQTLRDD